MVLNIILFILYDSIFILLILYELNEKLTSIFFVVRVIQERGELSGEKVNT